jgi:hypothetical protein
MSQTCEVKSSKLIVDALFHGKASRRDSIRAQCDHVPTQFSALKDDLHQERNSSS